MTGIGTERGHQARFLVRCIAPSVALIALALLCLDGTAFTWHEGVIEQTGSWTGDDWAGGPYYTMEYSHDGSMLLLVGYGGPDEVLILDRGMGVLGRWEPEGEDLSVEGASWSTSDLSVTVWGANATNGNDTLLVLSAPDLDPAEGLNLTAASGLVDIDTARLLVEDFIMAVGGRDAAGVSRLMVFEAPTGHLISDVAWKGNATIVALEYDGIDLLVVDELGFVTSVESMTWVGGTRWEGPGGRPSAWSIGSFAGDRICIVGYAGGQVRVLGGYPRELLAEADTGDGPVTGLASLFMDPRFYAVATIPNFDRGRIAGWIHNETWGEREWSNVIVVSPDVLSMEADPQVAGQFLVAFDNGTVASYRASIILDLPPIINITHPPRKATWEGVVTVRGTVDDEVDRVDWVRYSIDDGEWMDANGTADFTIVVDIDALHLQPATHSLLVRAFDGTNEQLLIYDFYTPQPPDDDEGGAFWYWFAGCTSLIAVVLIALYLARRGGRGPSPTASDGGGGPDGTESGPGTGMAEPGEVVEDGAPEEGPSNP